MTSPPAASPRDPLIGKLISRYHIVARLGEGGMGVVYKAQDTVLERSVALKFLRLDRLASSSAYERFMREAKLVASLDHPNICTVYGLDKTEDGQAYLAMAYYEGESLAERLSRGALPFSDAVGMAVQIAEGLGQAHRRGIVHRDIKPGNLFLTTQNIVKILDFGLALLLDETRLTAASGLVGTLRYMAPEQLAGRAIDSRSDIWAFGLVLHEMITGKLPARVKTGIPQVDTEVPAALRSIILRALRWDPDERYRDGLEILTDLAVLAHGSGTGSHLAGSIPSPLTSRPSIAVMPFVHSDPDDEYFGDGLTDELIISLARLPRVRIVSRSSVFQFKAKSIDARSIAEKLNVDLVLEGSIRHSRERLRVAVQLTDARDGYLVWSERYDRELQDVFAVQDEITEAIVAQLRARLKTATEVPGPVKRTSKLEAYQLYLRGRFYWYRQTPEAINKARDLFERAILEDPNYVPAHAAIADCLTALGFWNISAAEEVWPQARATALRALEMDSSVASAHVSMGWVFLYGDWNWKAAYQEFKKALELAPGDPSAHYAYATLLAQVGQHELSISELREALELDPLSLDLSTALSFTYYYARRYDEAIAQVEKTLELDPNYYYVKIVFALIHAAQDQIAKAVEILEELNAIPEGSPLIAGFLGYAYGREGNVERARALQEKLKADSAERATVACALISIGLGDHDQAFAWLESALQHRDSLLCFIDVLSCYDPLRADPRFQAIRQRLGLFDPTRSE